MTGGAFLSHPGCSYSQLNNDLNLNFQDFCHYNQLRFCIKLITSNCPDSRMTNLSFSNLTIFKRFTCYQLSAIEPLFEEVYENRGTLLFEQGCPASHLYIIVEGEILIQFKPEDGPPLAVTTIKPDGVVGWSAALGSESYTSSATCIMDCRLLRVHSADLQDFYRSNPDIGSMLLKCLAEVVSRRKRNAHTQVVGLLEKGMQVKINPAYPKDLVQSGASKIRVQS